MLCKPPVGAGLPLDRQLTLPPVVLLANPVLEMAKDDLSFASRPAD